MGNVCQGKLLATRDKAIRATYSGEVSVANLATVDKATSEDFLKWDSLHLDGINVATAPLSVAIRQVALTDFYSRIVVTPEGTLNVQGIVKKEGQSAAGETAGGNADNTMAATRRSPRRRRRRSPSIRFRFRGGGSTSPIISSSPTILRTSSRSEDASPDCPRRKRGWRMSTSGGSSRITHPSRSRGRSTRSGTICSWTSRSISRTWI
jgi:hypothetical protein